MGGPSGTSLILINKRGAPPACAEGALIRASQAA